jgi:hypothetical protein
VQPLQKRLALKVGVLRRIEDVPAGFVQTIGDPRDNARLIGAVDEDDGFGWSRF